MIDYVKVIGEIRYLETQDTWHESADIEDGNLAEILSDYGVSTCFNEEESKLIKEFLISKATKAEIAESALWSRVGDPLLVQSIPDKSIPRCFQGNPRFLPSTGSALNVHTTCLPLFP
jgi:hypothetical protein